MNDEIERLLWRNNVLAGMARDAIINVLDGMFEQLEEGRPPSDIKGLKELDMEEVVRFLCAYHRIKMKEGGK